MTPSTAALREPDPIFDSPEPREVEAFRASVLAKLRYMVAKEPGHARDHDWLMAVSARRARPRHRPLERDDAPHVPRRPQARLLLFARVPDRPHAVRRAVEPRPGRDRARGAGRARRRFRPPARRSSPIPRSATAASAGSPRASWKAWRRCRIPAHGYGIRYDHGIFRQVLTDGWQHEMPEEWLSYGNPWEFERPEVTCTVGFGGTVEEASTAAGGTRAVWHPAETVDAVAFDTPIPGWRGRHVNTLRLWSARAADPLLARRLQPRRPCRRAGRARAARGDFARALSERRDRRRPGPAPAPGILLRLGVAAGPDCAGTRRSTASSRSLPDHVAIQLNDTHPAIAVPELMRLLVDLHGMPWERAWRHRDARVQLHQPHAAARGARDVAGRRCWSACCRGTCRSSTASTRSTSTACARPADDGGFLSSVSLIDEDRRAPRAHGPPRVPRRAPRQRRVGAAHRSACARRCSATCTRCIPTASSTRPTASRSGAGCSRPIRG